MVLQLDGLPLSHAISLKDLYEASPRLLKSAQRLASQPTVSVGPSGVKYVRQKGFAVSFTGDTTSEGKRIYSLGTEDVLTCHVVVLRYDRVTALGHFDEYVQSETLDSLIKQFENKVREVQDECFEENYWEDDWEWEEWDYEDVQDASSEESISKEPIDFQNTPISLRMVGGYSDEAGKAGRLGKRLLEYFQNHIYIFQIEDLCLGDVNTQRGMYRKEPIIGGVSCDLKSGRLHRATFSSRAFLRGMSDGMVNQLLLGPSLIKKPNALKRIILEKEDQGYSI